MYAHNKDLKRLAMITALLIAVIMFVIPTAAGTNVSVVVVPEGELLEDETFYVRIEIDDVVDLDSGQFDLYFDSKVVDVIDGDCISAVEAGSIAGTDIPIEGCNIIGYSDSFAGDLKLRVSFNLPGTGGVSGSGLLATINFEVTGKNGDHSVLNFDRGELVDTGADKMGATWVDGNVAISTSEPTPTHNSTTTPTSTTNQEHEVSVYVINRDDDTLDVYLSIDGKELENKKIKSGEVSTKYSEPYARDYKLEEGSHNFTIWWYDKGTNANYIKTEEHNIIDTTTIRLLTDEHTKDEDKISAHVYIKNRDDDDLNIYLYIDGNYEKYMSVSSNSSGDYGVYEFEEDDDTLHTFKLEWSDPGTGEDYEKISRIYITSEEAVTLYIDKHTEEDIILLPDETPTPVSTPAQPTDNSQPSARNTPSSTAFHTDPTLSENSAENNGLGQGITWYSLVGLIAAVFALLQIRRG